MKIGLNLGSPWLTIRRCLRIFERQYFTCEMITGRITSLAMHSRTIIRSPAERWSLHRLILVAQASVREPITMRFVMRMESFAKSRPKAAPSNRP